MSLLQPSSRIGGGEATRPPHSYGQGERPRATVPVRMLTVITLPSPTYPWFGSPTTYTIVLPGAMAKLSIRERFGRATDLPATRLGNTMELIPPGLSKQAICPLGDATNGKVTPVPRFADSVVAPVDRSVVMTAEPAAGIRRGRSSNQDRLR